MIVLTYLLFQPYCSESLVNVYISIRLIYTLFIVIVFSLLSLTSSYSCANLCHIQRDSTLFICSHIFWISWAPWAPWLARTPWPVPWIIWPTWPPGTPWLPWTHLEHLEWFTQVHQVWGSKVILDLPLLAQVNHTCTLHKVMQVDKELSWCGWNDWRMNVWLKEVLGHD